MAHYRQGSSPKEADSKALAQQHNQEQRTTMLSVVKSVYAENGLMGFWKGVLPSLAMVRPALPGGQSPSATNSFARGHSC